MPVTATYSPAQLRLSVLGTIDPEVITVSRTGPGALLVNGGAVPVSGGTPTVANTALIEVVAGSGDDVVTLDEANGALPAGELYGEAGNDALTGGSNSDTLHGGADNDTLFGRGGADTLFGGTGNDVLAGGDGDDQVFGGDGNDTLIWNPGDDSDLMEGEAGSDVAQVNGGGGAEVFTITANGTRVRFDRIDPAPFTLDIGTVETLVLNAGAGDDTISATGNLAALIALTLDGGDGNDTIRGGNGIDLILGGTGSDFVDGQQGNDTAFLGTGNDIFQWDPGDGSDVIEGQAGTDTMQLNGSAGNEIISILPNGGRVMLTRDLGSIVHDLDDVERFTVNALGGADSISVGDLTGSDVNRVTVNLSGTLGGTAGDAQIDAVTVHGTSGADTIGFASAASSLSVTGLAAVTTVNQIEATDRVVANGGLGNDRFVATGALAGAPTASIDGAEGTDTVEVTGNGGDEAFTITANGARVLFGRIAPTAFTLDIGTSEALVLSAGAGNDTISTAGNLAALIGLTLDGGGGNDTILGGNGADVLLGGDGNDFIDGQQGSDSASMGSGNDVFQWDPGDGSDIVEGQAGTDTLAFNGSAGNEMLNLSANGGRALLTRDLGSVAMDLNGIESFSLNLLGGADTIIIGNLTGTGAANVSINLAGTLGGSAGDGLVDVVTVNGSGATDNITITGSGTSLTVTGLAASVGIANAEGANDTVVISALGGNDTIAATTLPAGVVRQTLDGGDGNDTILGSQGADTVLGGAGDDTVSGDNGNDLAFLGAGDDLFQWGPGDGNDVVEGQDGIDELDFTGSNASENISILANGGRISFFRDVAAVTMDLDDVEQVTYRALGGGDNIVVGDLTGTDIANVEVRLEDSIGEADLAADAVTVNASNAADFVTVSSAGGIVTVIGLVAATAIHGAEAANDRLVMNGLGGDDVIDASGLAAGVIALTVNAGLGNDLVLGSAGADLVSGGDGNDTALLGAGSDIFVWNPGDDNDIIDGQAGTDTLQFNGSNVTENITISANGGRVVLFRDIAAVTMDLNDTEVIAYAALGGADNIAVGDLSGTDVNLLALDLAATAGGAVDDGQLDTLTLNASAGNNTIALSGASGALLTVAGLPASVTIAQFATSGTVDRLTILAGGGNDTISAVGLIPPLATLTIDGGDGDDVIRSNGDGTYLGGLGDDMLFAGLTSSSEVIDGGEGIDTLDTTTWGGVYSIHMVTGVTNYFGESFVNFENLVTGDGADTITGTAGDNIISTQNGNDSLFGSDGLDTLDGGAGDDTLDGGTGSDTASYFDATGRVVITLGLPGAPQNTRSSGFDTLVSIENLEGSLFNDRLEGDASANTLDGWDGNDTLLGGAGDDLLLGRAGNDRLTGGAGIDTLRGGLGNDVYYLDDPGDAGDTVLEFDGGGEDTVWAGFDYTLGVHFDNLQLRHGDWQGTGNALANTLRAGGGNNTLAGLNGNDTIFGGNGRDTLDGGAGNDRLFGGIGRDILAGGTGDDRFIYDSAMELGAMLGDSDIIADFDRVEGDRIVLADVDANNGTPENDTFSLIGTDAFSGTAGELRYYFDAGRTVVEMDTNGDSLADLLLRLEGEIDLVARDFIF